LSKSKLNIAVLYTDASFDFYFKISCCGYFLIYKDEPINLVSKEFNRIYNTTQAEEKAISIALQDAFLLPDVNKIIVYTDSEAALYKVKKNKFFYTDLGEVLEVIKEHNIEVDFRYIKGHNGDKYNEMVDNWCRNKLKEFRTKK
jgi:ribonuclease HI